MHVSIETYAPANTTHDEALPTDLLFRRPSAKT
jgi:hypothetical protein